MRSSLPGMLLLGGILAAGAFGFGAVSASAVHAQKQSAIIHLTNPTLVNGHVLPEGEYLIVHDDDKMARGGPCTSFFCFDTEQGWSEVVSFHCRPIKRDIADKTMLTIETLSLDERVMSGLGVIEKLTEYQFAGDSEGHGVPEDQFVSGSDFARPQHPGFSGLDIY